MSRTTESVSVTEFKAKCLKLFEELAERKRSRIVVTKHGKPVAEVTPPRKSASTPRVYGCMRGTVILPPGYDLTKPVLDEPLDVERGILHR
jgi:prevent-host-death family protein